MKLAWVSDFHLNFISTDEAISFLNKLGAHDELLITGDISDTPADLEADEKPKLSIVSLPVLTGDLHHRSPNKVFHGSLFQRMSHSTSLIAVTGDVHHHVWLAVKELDRLEKALGRKIGQVFSVGDFGLFLCDEDWKYLTGPPKYRRTDQTPQIAEAWKMWRWPLSLIGGNHEPFNRLRDFDPAYYGAKLRYTNAGYLAHQIEGLTVYGLTGIYGPDYDQSERFIPWPAVLKEVQAGRERNKALCYYQKAEITTMLDLKRSPHLLLTHDWPFNPNLWDGPTFDSTPEYQLMQHLMPQFYFAGHHHRHSQIPFGKTLFEGLNIINSPTSPHKINLGWCRLLEWDGQVLSILNTTNFDS